MCVPPTHIHTPTHSMKRKHTVHCQYNEAPKGAMPQWKHTSSRYARRQYRCLKACRELMHENQLAKILGSTVVSPYVGMARKQNGGYNASISVQTLILHLVVNSTRLKTVRSALWHCPNSTVALRLLENVVKVTNLEVVKIEFRHLPFHLLLLQTA